MIYSEFIKAEMLKLKPSSMAHKEKFKHIADLWKKSGHSKNSHTTTTKKGKKSTVKTEEFLLNELGVKKEKPKKAINAVVKALEKLKKPEMKVAEELILAEKDMPHKHPMHLLEKHHHHEHPESDNENGLGF